MKYSRRHTKPCIYFQSDTCPLSADQCDYAHILASPEQAEHLKSPQATLRSKPCRYFLAGQCRDGYWCRFKHPAPALPDGSFLEKILNTEADSNNASDTTISIDVRELKGAWKAKPNEHPKYRTRPCRNFLLGKCIFGDRCSYLHSTSAPASFTHDTLSCSSSSPTTTGSICPITAPATPPHLSPFTLTPLPARVPNSTPVPEFELDVPVPFGSISQGFCVIGDGERPQTPSNASASSQPTDWPPTPVSSQVRSGRANVYSSDSPYAPYPSSEAANRQDMNCQMITAVSMPMSLHAPPTPPYSVYSPGSSVPLTIVHIPMTATTPIYPNIPATNSVGASPTTESQRALARPESVIGGTTPNSQRTFFRTKPCRFFCELGRCHKGDRCNFIHPQGLSAPIFPVPPRQKGSQSHHRKGAAVKPRVRKPADDRLDNFYKINWRVVGGGVRMSNDEHSSNSEQESPSGGTCSPLRQESTIELGSPISLSDPIDLRKREILPLSSENQPSARTSRVNALALNLDLTNKRTANTSQALGAGPGPVIIVQDEDETESSKSKNHASHRADNVDDDNNEKQLVQVFYRRILRSKSTPPTPVSAHLELPFLLFAAESP